MFCVPASLGIVVPVTAMSDREPPTWGSSDLEDIFGMFCFCSIVREKLLRKDGQERCLKLCLLRLKFFFVSDLTACTN